MADHGSASLHAGLIERARPRVALTPGVVPLLPPVSEPGRTEDMARAVSARRIDLETGANPLASIAELELRPVAPPVVMQQSAKPQGRRFGMTVRVDDDLHDKLMAHRRRTGRTYQSILYSALRNYLPAT